MLTVFNVGQGDSILFQPNKHCTYHNKPLLVDCGPRNSGIDKNLTINNFNLMITHSHKDHIGGLNRDILQKSIRIIIPYYLPEILKISQFIKKYISTDLKSIDFNDLFKVNILLAKQGDYLCEHIKILNPPEEPNKIFQSYEENLSIESAMNLLGEFGFNFPTESIINYRSEIIESLESINEQYDILSRRFVHLFFIRLTSMFQRYHKPAYLDLLSKHFERTSNQVSIVFRYDYDDEDKILMTGDADVSVFERLIDEREDLTADILKIPHHGSRENITKSILREINPKVAIISHNNGIFGRSKDTHPHYDVIEALESEGIQVFYTNDVRKGSNAIRLRSIGFVNNGTIEFI